MKTEQVIEGIGKAVAATQPAQEYCLFWWDWWPTCMTKGEWSGWMQAIGAVAAILIVWWQTNSQKNALKRAQEEAITMKLREQLVATLFLLEGMMTFCIQGQLIVRSTPAGIMTPAAENTLKESIGRYAQQLVDRRFLDINYIELSMDVQKVLDAANLFLLGLEVSPSKALDLLQNLITECEKAHRVLYTRELIK